MSRIHVIQLLVLSALALFATTAPAQFSGSDGRILDPAADRGGDREACRRVGASRTRARCRPEQTTAPQELTVKVEIAELPSAQCEATSTTQYQQRNTIARVDTTVSVADCTAASGELTIAARIRDASSEVKSLEFPETWQRSADQEAKLTADYPIGANVDLLSVRVRGLTCTCADPRPEGVSDAPAN